MNRAAVFVLALASLCAASHVFTVEVDRTGLASATLSIEGDETVEVPLPPDASNFRIVGGSYSMANGSATVSSGGSGFTTFSFTSSSLSAKSDGSWKLSFTAPEGATAVAYMPPYATIESSYPQSETVSSSESRTRLKFPAGGQISVYYRLEDVPKAEEDGAEGLVLAAFILALGAIIASYILRSRRPSPAPPSRPPPATGPAPDARQPPASGAAPPLTAAPPPQEPVSASAAPSLEMTPGKAELMETLNDNDVKIVNFLLGSGGRARRNEIGRKTGISKSSLTMALNRLEKRKIIELDRTSTTHFVKLGDYFLRR